MTISELCQEDINNNNKKRQRHFIVSFVILMQKIFKKLLKSATIYDQELNREIDIVEKNCDIGLKYRGKKVETSTRIFLIQITVDLKEIDRTYTLHLILVDHATRCSAATYVKKKKKEGIAEL